jgi:hypothetical protein
MNRLEIASTKSTPEVNLDPIQHELSIKGQSYPENSYKFYEPIIHWLDQYAKTLNENQNVIINFDLPYINTSSSKCLMMLLDKLDEAYLANKNIVINWACDLQNSSEVECIEEFIEDLSIQCTIIPR